MKKGEIWLVDLSGGVGSEQGGVRPCLVMQDNRGCENSPTTIVCPITSKVKSFSLTHLPISGLKLPSYALFEQIRVVDKSRFRMRLIQLDEFTMKNADATLRLTMGCM